MKKNVFILLLIILMLTITVCRKNADEPVERALQINVAAIDSSRIIEQANGYLNEAPISITASSCPRSLGSRHDFYSEGDYWWPNPDDPQGPYIRRDGMTNPENFTAHRETMRRMSIQVASLTAAFKITGDRKYAAHAVEHLRAWLINAKTRMNPNMNFAQAIKGVCQGRGVGLIDGIHLVEPAQSVMVLENRGGISKVDANAIKTWFAEFLHWMTTHEYGIDERERTNNHGTCWVMQAAEYARLNGNEKIMAYCRDRFKTILLPNQLAADGSFPLELARTKPYGYSLFNIDVMAMVCQILSTKADNLWKFKLPTGQGMEQALAFIVPYIEDKSTWPYSPDVMYWDQWPVRQPCLLFGGLAFQNADYLEVWKKLTLLPESEEGLRNFPIRQPILWVD